MAIINKVSVKGQVYDLGQDGVYDKWYLGKEIDLTWEEIHNKVLKGDFSGLRIGDYKTITLNSSGLTNHTLKMRIAGIDTYYSEKSTYPPVIISSHHIDWISDSPVVTLAYNDLGHNNSTASGRPIYLDSLIYSGLQTLYNDANGLSSEIKKYITSKIGMAEVRYASGSTSLTSATSYTYTGFGNLWIPTEYEVFGTVKYGSKCPAMSTKQYELFKNSHILFSTGQGGWLMTAVDGSSTSCVTISNYTGQVTETSVATRAGVLLCFRTI